MFHRLLTAVATVALLSAPAFAREITHAMGTTDVPDHPQRIVVLTNEGTEALLAVGIKPVGAVKSFLGNPWYDHIATDMADVVVVGEESTVNLEVLLSLEPDLILGNKMRHEKIYEQLSAIAPTVVSERLRGDWKINMALYTDAAGKGDEGKAALAKYDARIAAIHDALGASLDEKISIARFMVSMLSNSSAMLTSAWLRASARSIASRIASPCSNATNDSPAMAFKSMDDSRASR